MGSFCSDYSDFLAAYMCVVVRAHRRKVDSIEIGVHWVDKSILPVCLEGEVALCLLLLLSLLAVWCTFSKLCKVWCYSLGEDGVQCCFVFWRRRYYCCFASLFGSCPFAHVISIGGDCLKCSIRLLIGCLKSIADFKRCILYVLRFAL